MAILSPFSDAFRPLSLIERPQAAINSGFVMMQALRADTCQNRHGGDPVISQGSSLDRITIRDWQGSAGNRLGIVLDDSPAPVTPQSGALFFTGDQRAKLIGIETRLDLGPGSARYNIDAWSETTWARDGTLSGGVARAGFSDKLRGTSNSIAACGRSVSFAGLFGIKLGAIEARKRCWRWRREPLRPLNSQGTRAPSMAGVSQ